MSSIATDSSSYRLPVPDRDAFARFRVWDSYYFPRLRQVPGALLEDVAADLELLAPFQIERFCAYLHVGLGTLSTRGGASPAEDPAQLRTLLERHAGKLLGVINLNANQVEASLAALDTWVRQGPVVGVYFKSSPPGCLACTHPNFDPIVERCGELGVMIMQHTWFKAAGKGDPGESTPAELAILAKRHPGVNFVCAHAGGDWERGLRAIRDCGNVWVETSGFDPTAGFVEMAVREVGAERIIFGGHFVSRSAGTELGKILGAAVSGEQRRLILGGNLRRLLDRVLPARSR